LFIAKQKG